MTLLSKFNDFPIAFGGASISGEGAGYGFGDISENEAIDLILQSYEQGFRVFDTAPIYGFGLSEKRLGKALKNYRDNAFLISKSGVTWHENKRVDMNNDPKIVTKMLEQSLRDLNSDYIDLYMVHWPDSKHDIRKTLEIYSKAKEQNKIKHIGLCNTTIDELQKASEVCKIEVVQSQFNFFENENSKILFPYLIDNKISFMSWGTFDKGILTGRVDKNRKFDSSDCRSWAPWWKDQDLKSKIDLVEKLKKITSKYEISLTQFALGYNFYFNELSMVICGIKNKNQLEDLVHSYKQLPNKLVIDSILKDLKNVN